MAGNQKRVIDMYGITFIFEYTYWTEQMKKGGEKEIMKKEKEQRHKNVGKISETKELFFQK